MSSSGLSSGAALAQAHLLDHDGDRVRQLVADAVERGLADQLGHQDLLGRVGEVAVGVERRPLGHQPDEQVGQQRRPGRRRRPTPARSRPTRCRSPRRARWMSSRCSPIRSGVARSVLVATAILVVRRTLASSVTRNRSPGPTFSLAGKHTATTSTSDQVRAHQVVEPLAEQRARPVQAGGVDQDQLGVRPVHDAAHHGAGGLRLVGGDHDLGARPARWSASTCRRWGGRRSDANPLRKPSGPVACSSRLPGGVVVGPDLARRTCPPPCRPARSGRGRRRAAGAAPPAAPVAHHVVRRARQPALPHQVLADRAHLRGLAGHPEVAVALRPVDRPTTVASALPPSPGGSSQVTLGAAGR